MEEKNSFKTEYKEMLDFIIELQENTFQQSEQLFSKKKTLEHQIAQIKTEEAEDLEQELEKVEKDWKKQQIVQQSFGRLQEIFLTMGQKVQKDDDIKMDWVNCGSKILGTQERDRNRISRDLHDCSVQELTSLVHKMEYCIKMIDKDPVRVKLELQTMISLNKSIINGMREIIYDLRPMSLNNIGLVATVDSYCLHLRSTSNVDVAFCVNGTERKMDSIVSVTLYRIIQEACGNAMRHARAKKISISITYLEYSVELDIEDNGIGFDLKQVGEQSGDNKLNGFGLSTMKERAKLLNGTFFIDSILGKGTKVYVSVPVNYTIGNGEEDD